MKKMQDEPTPADVWTPDWTKLEDDVFCPLCEYNLRGLAEPRCPECGYRFEWRDLLDPQRSRHPYLFEHHPNHNFKSFWKTIWGGLRPLKFWRSLKPNQPSRPMRLILYWCLAAGIFIIGNVANAFFGSISLIIFISIFFLAWPWLTFLTLMIFNDSMRRVRVKPVHVLRCVLYSSDIVLWLGLGLLVMVGGAASGLIGRSSASGIRLMLFGLFLLTLSLQFLRLWAAYRNYLKFDHPAATVLASQIIVVLTVFIILLKSVD